MSHFPPGLPGRSGDVGTRDDSERSKSVSKTKTVKLCSVEGCGKKHFGKGFCRKHYQRLWIADNREKLKKKHKIYYQNNKEKVCEYYGKNKETINSRRRQLYKERGRGVYDKEKQRVYDQKYRKNNKEKLKKYWKKYREINKQKKKFFNQRWHKENREKNLLKMLAYRMLPKAKEKDRFRKIREAAARFQAKILGQFAAINYVVMKSIKEKEESSVDS